MNIRGLVLAGLIAGLSALLQTAPVWLGEPLGLALAVFACLPLALLATVYPRGALPAFGVSVLLCFKVHVEEGVIFAVTNGPFGLALGAALGAGWRLPGAVAAAARWRCYPDWQYSVGRSAWRHWASR